MLKVLETRVGAESDCCQLSTQNDTRQGVPTTSTGAIFAPTRREMLMSPGALAIGIAWRTAQAAPRPAWPICSVESAGGQAYLVGETYPRPTDWHDSRIEALVPGCSML
jgi:hypothetical protein